jgi:FkbM family methyltransferase
MLHSHLYRGLRKLIAFKDVPENIRRLGEKVAECEASLRILSRQRSGEEAVRAWLRKKEDVYRESSRLEEARDLAYFLALKRLESTSQFLQDLWVLWSTHEKRGGYFVEFGASTGVTGSNTFLLENKYGWRGILAEPLPSCHERLSQRQAILDKRCVWTTSGEKLKFICAPIAELSGLARTAPEDFHSSKREEAPSIVVETVSLDDLLTQHQAPRIIDYLSMDTEGSEYEIISHFDFSRFQFRLISVEHNFVAAKRQAIHDLLIRNGYVRKFEEFSDVDDWYENTALKDSV